MIHCRLKPSPCCLESGNVRRHSICSFRRRRHSRWPVIGSTTTPDILHGLKNKVPQKAYVVDAPIVGGVRYAKERSVTFLVGGTQPAVDKAEVVLSTLGKIEKVGEFGSGVSYKLITNVLVMAAEAGLREALDLTDILGGNYETALRLFGIGPMAAVVSRALDESNPRPLRASAEDFDVLLSAIRDKSLLPISVLSAQNPDTNQCSSISPGR